MSQNYKVSLFSTRSSSIHNCWEGLGVGHALSVVCELEWVCLQVVHLIIRKFHFESIPRSSYFQVKVGDRTAVVTANAETVAVQPVGIQEAINAEIGNSHQLTYHGELQICDQFLF